MATSLRQAAVAPFIVLPGASVCAEGGLPRGVGSSHFDENEVAPPMSGTVPSSSRPGRPRHQTPAHLIALIRQLRVTHGLPAWALGRALGGPATTASARTPVAAISRRAPGCRELPGEQRV